jgi:hypothetical protein
MGQLVMCLTPSIYHFLLVCRRGMDQLFTDCPVFPIKGVVLQAPRRWVIPPASLVQE